MNRYLIVHRLRWPALLLLTGILAMLDQARIVSWGHSWPLYLILFGVLALAERAVLANEPPPASPYAGPYAGYPNPAYGAPGYAGPGYAGTANPAPAGAPVQTEAAVQASSTGIVPAGGDLSLSRRMEEEER